MCHDRLHILNSRGIGCRVNGCRVHICRSNGCRINSCRQRVLSSRTSFCWVLLRSTKWTPSFHAPLGLEELLDKRVLVLERGLVAVSNCSLKDGSGGGGFLKALLWDACCHKCRAH